MHVTYRSYLTAGVAAIGASAIALSPVQPIPNQLAPTQERAIANLSVDLAAQVNPIELWQQVLLEAQSNIAQVQAFKAARPLPLLTTIQANLQTYAAALPDTQFIVDSIKRNINTFLYAPWSPGPCASNPCSDPAFYQGINISGVPITNSTPIGPLSQRQLYQILPGAVEPAQAAALAPLLALAGNTWSGQLAAVIGMLAGPVVQLGRSFTAIKDALALGDTATALNELVNIPALTTNAFLNGIGPVDLTDLVNKIMPLPPELSKIGLNMGGLLSPPVKYAGTLANPTALSAGTLFDNLTVTATATIRPLPPITVVTPGQQVGFYSAAVGLGQYLGTLMLVPPPTATAAVAPTAAVKAAAAVEAPAAVDLVSDISAPVEAPAPKAVSVSAPEKQSGSAGGNDNGGNDNGGNARGGHKGSRG